MNVSVQQNTVVRLKNQEKNATQSLQTKVVAKKTLNFFYFLFNFQFSNFSIKLVIKPIWV